MGVRTRRTGARGAMRFRSRRTGRGIVDTILALDDDPILLCACEVGCADCDGSD